MSRLERLLHNLPRLLSPEAPSRSTLVEFTLFPRLPLELKQKIWFYAANHPRVIHLVKDGAIKPGRTSRVTAQSKQPAILQATRESRAEGKMYYELCSQKEITTHDKWYDSVLYGTRSWSPDSFYINFGADTFLLPHAPFYDEDAPSTIPKNYETFNYPLDVLERIRFLKFVYNDPTNPVSDTLNHPLKIFSLRNSGRVNEGAYFSAK
jgi:hypothetical protein